MFRVHWVKVLHYHVPLINNQYGLRLTISYEKSQDVLCSAITKFLIDRHGMKMTDVVPSIAGQHVR